MDGKAESPDSVERLMDLIHDPDEEDLEIDSPIDGLKNYLLKDEMAESSDLVERLMDQFQNPHEELLEVFDQQKIDSSVDTSGPLGLNLTRTLVQRMLSEDVPRPSETMQNISLEKPEVRNDDEVSSPMSKNPNSQSEADGLMLTRTLVQRMLSEDVRHPSETSLSLEKPEARNNDEVSSPMSKNPVSQSEADKAPYVAKANKRKMEYKDMDSYKKKLDREGKDAGEVVEGPEKFKFEVNDEVED